jgi:hypothetical protein
MVERKDAWNDCVAWDDRPKTLPEGLKILADWFDAVYNDNGEVQVDLRKWAIENAKLRAAAYRLVAHAKDRQQEEWASLPDVLTLAEILESINEK